MTNQQMYVIEREITRFEQPSIWEPINKCEYDKKTVMQEVRFLRRANRDIKFRINKKLS